MILLLEKQVCSLEPAMMLKELGVKQESLFCWVANGIEKPTVMLTKEWASECNPNSYICSAFTVAELGEMLPMRVKGSYLRITHDEHFGWHLIYEPEIVKNDSIVIDALDKTEAEARAKMLIYLLDNNLIKADDNG